MVNGFSFFHCVASPFHSFVTTPTPTPGVFDFPLCGFSLSLFCNYLHLRQAESGRIPKGSYIPKGAFVHWAMQLLSAAVQKGEMHRTTRSGLVRRVRRVCALRCSVRSTSVDVMISSTLHVYGAMHGAALFVQC